MFSNPSSRGTASDVYGVTYIIQGTPVRDAEQLIWKIEARPL